MEEGASSLVEGIKGGKPRPASEIAGARARWEAASLQLDVHCMARPSERPLNASTLSMPLVTESGRLGTGWEQLRQWCSLAPESDSWRCGCAVVDMLPFRESLKRCGLAV